MVLRKRPAGYVQIALAGYVEAPFVLGSVRVTFRYEIITKPRRSRTWRHVAISPWYFKEVSLPNAMQTPYFHQLEIQYYAFGQYDYCWIDELLFAII